MSYLVIEKFDGRSQQIWDHSSIMNILGCPRKYQFEALDGWFQDRPQRDVAKNFGVAFHEGLENYDIVRFKGGGRQEALAAALRYVAKFKPLLTPPPEHEQGFKGWDNSKTFETLVRALVWYDDYWGDNNPLAATMDDGSPGLEVRFEVPIGYKDYRMSGRIDKMMYNRDSLFLVDHKTTGKALTNWYWGDYELNNQVKTYLWATRKMLDMPIAGFIVDGIQLQVGGARFQRRTFDETESQLEEWHAEIINRIKIFEKFAEDGVYPANYSACGNYGGCAFRAACSKPPEVRESILERLFSRKEDFPRK